MVRFRRRLDFYPRPPRGGRLWSTASASPFINFYPRPPRGGRHQYTEANKKRFYISIHALREEGDGRGGRPDDAVGISIHALREEGDRQAGADQGGQLRFLSTPSARRATPSQKLVSLPKDNFYPRPPRGGRPFGPHCSQAALEFLSTPSARRATGGLCDLHRPIGISIHALREEGDLDVKIGRRVDYNFYPRPPRGGRPRSSAARPSTSNFYPRPPRGGRPWKLRL